MRKPASAGFSFFVWSQYLTRLDAPLVVLLHHAAFTRLRSTAQVYLCAKERTVALSERDTKALLEVHEFYLRVLKQTLAHDVPMPVGLDKLGGPWKRKSPNGIPIRALVERYC